MAGPRISSKNALKQYILSKLGAPVVNIEITDEQLENAIADTVEDYSQYAYAGVAERYIPVTLQQGINEYVMPYDIFAVLSVNTVNMLGIGAGGNGAAASSMFSLNQFVAADLYKPGVAKIDMIGYEMINEMIETMGIIFASKLTFDYSSVTKILHIFSELEGNPKAIIQVYRKIDLEGTPDPFASSVSGIPSRYLEENVYDERWVKRMCAARAQEQWGRNLMKYNSSVLPNGGSLNAEWIYNEGKASVETLTTELHEQMELPVDFFVG